MRSGFARLHPLVDLTFFVLVLAFAMFLSHPAVQLAGLVCAALFALRCTGRGFGRRMAMLLPLMLLAAVVNPLVSHQGVTVLFRFPSGNACTLESVLYGISAAVLGRPIPNTVFLGAIPALTAAVTIEDIHAGICATMPEKLHAKNLRIVDAAFAEVASREIAATRDLVAAEQAATDVTAVLSEKDAMFSLAAEMLVEGEGRDFDVRDC